MRLVDWPWDAMLVVLLPLLDSKEASKATSVYIADLFTVVHILQRNGLDVEQFCC